MEAKEILRVHIAELVILTGEQFDCFFSHSKKQNFQKGYAIINVGNQVNFEYFMVSGFLISFFNKKITANKKQ